MKFAYADPPYFGRAAIWYGNKIGVTQLSKNYGGTSKVGYKPANYHPDSKDWDDIETHKKLIKTLENEYDGFALSLAHDNLQTLLPLFSEKIKVCIWIKWTLPGGSIVVNNYEPVILKLPKGKKMAIAGKTIPDVLDCKTRPNKGFAGAKPDAFNKWILDLLNFQNGDILDDLFPGTNGMSDAIASRLAV